MEVEPGYVQKEKYLVCIGLLGPPTKFTMLSDSHPLFREEQQRVLKRSACYSPIWKENPSSDTPGGTYRVPHVS